MTDDAALGCFILACLVVMAAVWFAIGFTVGWIVR